MNFQWLFGNKYPKPLPTFFEEIKCPECGKQDWEERQDGGHDSLMVCKSCHSEFGVNWGPFNTIHAYPVAAHKD